METVKIGDILADKTGDISESDDYCVYVARDADLVLYVGRSSRNVEERFLEHLGISSRLDSRSFDIFGRFVLENKPESLSWQVDYLTLDDCFPLMQRHIPTLPEATRLRWTPEKAEIALIREYKPSLNRTHNENPTPIPEKYRISQSLQDAPCDRLGISPDLAR